MTVGLIYRDVAIPSEQESVGFPGPLAGRYKLAPDDFEAHLDAIEAEGRRVGLVLPDARRPRVALTFDDGGSSAPGHRGMLERRGWRGHFFVTTGCIGKPGFVRADEVRELSARGHDVGSHAHTHPTYMGKLGRDEIRREWHLSRELLGEVLGEPPATAAIPGGFVSPIVVEEAARAGYRVLMTSEPIRTGAAPRRHVGGRPLHDLGLDPGAHGCRVRARVARGRRPPVARVEHQGDREAHKPARLRRPSSTAGGGVTGWPRP